MSEILAKYIVDTSYGESFRSATVFTYIATTTTFVIGFEVTSVRYGIPFANEKSWGKSFAFFIC